MSTRWQNFADLKLALGTGPFCHVSLQYFTQYFEFCKFGYVDLSQGEILESPEGINSLSSTFPTGMELTPCVSLNPPWKGFGHLKAANT